MYSARRNMFIFLSILEILFLFFLFLQVYVICRIGRNQTYLNLFYNQVTHVSIQNSSIQLGFWKSVKCLNHKSINRIRVFIGLEMEAITINIFHATYFEKNRMFWYDPRIVRITCKHFDQNCPIWGFGEDQINEKLHAEWQYKVVCSSNTEHAER